MAQAPGTGKKSRQNSGISNVFCAEVEFGKLFIKRDISAYYADSNAKRGRSRKNLHFCD